MAHQERDQLQAKAREFIFKIQ